MRSAEFSGNPIRLRFTLNGEAVEIESRPDARLIDLLRDRLGLTGAKVGCDIGRCGACMVLVDGDAVNGCLVMAYRLEGATIVTAEALDLLAEGRAARAGTQYRKCLSMRLLRAWDDGIADCGAASRTVGAGARCPGRSGRQSLSLYRLPLRSPRRRAGDHPARGRAEQEGSALRYGFQIRLARLYRRRCEPIDYRGS